MKERPSWLVPVKYAGPRKLRMASAAPAFFRSKRAAPISGLARHAGAPQGCDGLALAELSGPELLALRSAFSRDRTAAALRLDMQAVAQIEADQAQLVRAILTKGV